MDIYLISLYNIQRFNNIFLHALCLNFFSNRLFWEMLERIRLHWLIKNFIFFGRNSNKLGLRLVNNFSIMTNTDFPETTTSFNIERLRFFKLIV